MERVYIIHEMIGWVYGCAYMCVLVWSTSSSASLRFWCSSHWLRPQPTRGTRHTMQKHASQMICKRSPVVPWLLIECSHQYWTFGYLDYLVRLTRSQLWHTLIYSLPRQIIVIGWVLVDGVQRVDQKNDVQPEKRGTGQILLWINMTNSPCAPVCNFHEKNRIHVIHWDLQRVKKRGFAVPGGTANMCKIMQTSLSNSLKGFRWI